MRNFFVAIFGVLPACALCVFVLPVLLFSVGEYLEDGESDSLIMIAWCALAVMGTFALFFSIESAPGPVRILGLACGIAGMYGLGGFSQIGPSLWAIFFVGPAAVAVLLVIEGLVVFFRDSDESNYWTQ